MTGRLYASGRHHALATGQSYDEMQAFHRGGDLPESMEVVLAGMVYGGNPALFAAHGAAGCQRAVEHLPGL